MEWQPIETAPKDGQYIIGYDPKLGGIVCQVWYCTVFKRWETLHNDYPMRDCVDTQHYIFKCRPTHWMPMPPAPDA